MYFFFDECNAILNKHSSEFLARSSSHHRTALPYLLPFYLFRGQRLSQSYIEGLAPQLAVSSLGVGRWCLPAPWPRRHDLRPAFTAEADGALQGQVERRGGVVEKI